MTERKHQECYEEVTRKGEAAPCEKRAVGYRLDTLNDGHPYPVCRRHLYAPIYVPDYDDVLAGFDPEPQESEAAS